jgi:[acyl-carrier-protein] S-malonyltransferase
MPAALLFPGQGAPAAGWRDAVAGQRPDLLQRARELLDGEDPFERFGEGTEFDQPAIYCASLAAFEIAARPEAGFHAGHSLGEIAALACAGAFTEHDGLRLVVERGRLMAAAGQGSGAGSMLAVRAPAGEVEEPAERHGVKIANFNSPSQTVLSGPTEAIAQTQAELADRDMLTKLLPVAGAFHTEQMAPAALGLKREAERISIGPPRVPVLSGRTGRPFEAIGPELAASLVEPVRWTDVVATLERAGVDRYVEVGPGKALAGLMRKSARGDVSVETTPLPEAAGAA